MPIKSFSSAKNFSTRKEWLAATWKEFVKELATIPAEDLRIYIAQITTKGERELFLRRAIARSRFNYGVGFREIGRETWLSSQALSAVKKASLVRKEYESDWTQVKARMIIKQIKETKKLREREKSQPARYRSTKYGKVRLR